MPIKAVDKQSMISIHFSLCLLDGSVVDGTKEELPLNFTMGDGTMLQSFEEAILGLRIGDENKVSLEPRETFGFADETNFHWIEKQKFAHLNDADPNNTNQPIEEGLLIDFDMPDGNKVAGQVLSINEDKILIDFNHPLCGKDVIFKVKVLDIK